MDMNQATVWWIACGLLVALELTTGTFYLLMLALGAAAAAIAAHLGFALAGQMVTGAVIGGAAVALWRIKRGQHRREQPPVASNPNVNLDIGQSVLVEQWGPGGTTSVRYRGAQWRARYLGSDAPSAGPYVIRAIEGSCLMLDH